MTSAVTQSTGRGEALIMAELRCSACDRLLMRIGPGPMTRIETKCPKCSAMNIWVDKR